MILKLLNIISLFTASNFAKEYKLIYQVNLFNLMNRTSQSYSESNDLESTLAVDGDVYTCAMVRWETGNNPESWWRVELDRLYDITHIRLLNYRDAIDALLVSSMQVIVSSGIHYQMCTWLRNEYLKYTNGFKDLYCFNTINGNVVTIKKFELYLFLCEVQVFADLKSVNLAYKRPLAQQDVLLGDTSYLLVDDDPLTCGIIRSQPFEIPWLRVVLNDIYYITDVKYSFEKVKSGDWYLKETVIINLSDNEVNYDERLCSRSSKNYYTDGKSLSIKCDKPISARFVTIRKYTGVDMNIFVICDIEVYSKGFPHDVSNITSRDCYPHEYKCLEGECIHKDWLCDGTNDCPLADDEGPSCKGDERQFKCKRINATIDIIHRCDGVYNCPDYSDEEHCFEMYTKYLTATFKGETNLYICSDHWDVKYSTDVCKQYDRSYIGTNYVSHNYARNHIKVNFLRTLSKDNSFMFLFDRYSWGSGCSSKKIVNIECAYRPESSFTCGKRYLPDSLYEPYIVKGQDARLGAWPWHVQISIQSLYYSEVVCGGSLIDKYWVLTAAHCVYAQKDLDEIFVKIGSNIVDNYFTDRYYVSRIIIHPLYVGKSYERKGYDIALIKLNSMVQYSPVVRPICLPEKELDNRTLMSYRHCVVTGFGRNQEGNRPALMVQARMNFVHTGTCQIYIKNVTRHPYVLNLNNMFCAGQLPLANGSNICAGDSGGPWACKASNGIWTQIGVVHGFIEYKNKICLNSLMIHVSHYLDFIRTEMKNNQQNQI